ncbi:uncharacterized protein LOC120347115 isoform X1 [Styela clava]
MSVDTSPAGSLSQKKLNGIYWKTFVGFVNKNSGNGNTENEPDRREKNRQIYRREGSFEYMELTAKDNVSMLSETETNSSSTDDSSIDATKDDRSTSMYAVLNMSKKKEIQISDEIAIFEGSPIRSHQLSLPQSSFPASPKCSPVLHFDLLPDNVLVPSPISGNCQRAVTLSNIDKDEVLFNDKDDIHCEEDTFDSSDPTSPSMEPAPWKEQCLSIQRWMVPHVLPDNEDEFMALPDSIPAQDYEYCHYVPTLEAILEENEESWDSPVDVKTTRSQSCSDNTGFEKIEFSKKSSAWSSANDLLTFQPQNQEDTFSTASTCGSLRRVSTFENLSVDGDEEQESDGSSDELDRPCDHVTAYVIKMKDDVSDLKHEQNTDDVADNGDVISSFEPLNDNTHVSELSNKLFPGDSLSEVTQQEEENGVMPTIQQNKVFPKPATETLSEVSSSSLSALESSREVIPSTSVQSLLDSEISSSGRGSPPIHPMSEQMVQKNTTRSRSSSSNVPRDSGVDDVISETANEIASASSRTEIDVVSQISSELSIPGLPEELYFDRRDIPKIVVMFAREELEKERIKQLSDDERSNGEITPIQYRKRSSTYDQFGYNNTDSAYSSHEGVHRRISQMKSNEASRLSTLSSSTPELSVMTEDALPYIPVSYASEAAAARRKKKRRATIHSSEYANRKRGAPRNNQAKTIISGGGFGNGFSSLRKKFRNRNRIGTSLRRSQSEKPQVSRSSPDMSGPMARFLNSPRRRLNKDDLEASPKAVGRRRSFRSAVSKLFRRIGSRFSSQQQQEQLHENDYPVGNDGNGNGVINTKSPPHKSTLDLIEEGKEDHIVTESVSTYVTARDHASISDDKQNYSPTKSRFSGALAPSNDLDEEFRQRSHSVPSRPKSKISPRHTPSEYSDVFESTNSVDENSLDKTIYV